VTGPEWWNERRYGMFLHANIATVASFSPIGEYADWYWSHLGGVAAATAGPAAAVLTTTEVHASPLAEVLAYHGDRWSHVEQYDDFLPFLSLHRFDADEVLDLAADAGMQFMVQTTKHHDGFCWWDAPGTMRTSVVHGPGRDLVAEVSAACRRRDIVYGTRYSLDDWSVPGRDAAEYAAEVLHPHVLDLVERYGSQVLWGDATSGRTSDERRGGAAIFATAELIERAQDLADMQGFELAINDGWLLDQATFSTMRHRPPPDIRRAPWALRRGLGPSPQFNRAERPEHMLSAGALLDLLTEVVAKGGNLLIDVSPGVDGTVSDLQQAPLRAVGDWLADHPEIVGPSRPFDQWGDAQVRYLTVADTLLAIDLAAASEVVLAGLTPDRYDVTSVVADDGGALHWEQHRGGVTISRIDRSPAGLAGLYRIGVQPAAEAIQLFDDRAAAPLALQPLLDAAVAGSVVQLGDGQYTGPVEVPAGVTLRGMGWDRTSIIGGNGSPGTGGVRLGDDARLEAIHVTGHKSAVALDGSGSAVVGCRCDGPIAATGHDVQILSVIGTTILIGGERAIIERCSLKGSFDDVGIETDSGFGHRIVGNELVDHLCSIRMHDASASRVAENRCAARWWAVHLVQCDHIEVVDNSIRNTMRAVDVDGGNGTVVSANWVADGDSGAVVEFGATDTSIVDNHIERCRIGVLVWDAPSTRIGSNTFIDIHEEEPCVFGPDAEA